MDCDGVLIKDKHYLKDTREVEFYNETLDLIKHANKSNWKVIILTNQSGIALNIFSEETYLNLRDYMIREANKLGAKIDGWYYCPNHEKSNIKRYQENLHLRKPNPGMIQLAQLEHHINLNNSIMVGDKDSDVLNIDGPIYYLIQGEYPLKNIGVKKFKNHLEMSEFKKKQIY